MKKSIEITHVKWLRAGLLALMLTFLTGMIFAQQTIEQGDVKMEYPVPEQCEMRSDWMMAFMNHMGQEASIGWIADQMDAGAQVMTHCLLQGVIVVIPEQKEMIDTFAVEEMLGYEPIDGSGASLFPSGPVTKVKEGLFYVDYTGKLAGVKVEARKLTFHMGNAKAPISVMAFTPVGAEEVELLYDTAAEVASGLEVQYEPLPTGVMSRR